MRDTLRKTIAMLLTGTALALPAAAHAGSSVEWRNWTGRLPSNAIRGGVDQGGSYPLYICRAHYVNGVHPGKLLRDQCHIGWGGVEVIVRRFEVLVSTSRRDHRDSRDRRDRNDWDDRHWRR